MEEHNEQGDAENKAKKELESAEHQSDRRTAAFVVRRLSKAQDQLCDLIADMRTFEHYSEIEDVTCSLYLIQRVKRRYRKFAEDGVWPEPT